MILFRATCGIRGQTLIINFPGSPKAIKESFNTVARVIPHAVDLILDQKSSVKTTHSRLQNNMHHTCPHSRTKDTLNLDNVAGRLRESPFPMVSLTAAQNILRGSVNENTSFEEVNIWKSFGRVLAETIYSSCDLPPFRASIKDGYAVIAKDGKGKRKVLGSLEAGHEVSFFEGIYQICINIIIEKMLKSTALVKKSN